MPPPVVPGSDPVAEPALDPAPLDDEPEAELSSNFLQVSTDISTLRLSALPCGLSLPSGFVFRATGLCLPKPSVEIAEAGATPFSISQFLTLSARLSESGWLY